MTSSLTFRGASVSSSPAHQWTYDVFVSFQGVDIRRNFTAHLYNALDRRGINTYIDDEELIREESISSGLPKAIEESTTSVVVLSKNYATSSRCLNVLQKILECRSGTKGQIVIPVFYQVDPSDVRNQQNSFGEAFARLEQRFEDDLPKVQKWKEALRDIAKFSPWEWHFNINSDEAKCIDEIVQKIARLVNAVKLLAKHPIAIESPLPVPDSSSSPAQVPDSSSSPSPFEIQAPVPAVNLSSSPSGNGEQGSNPSNSSDGVILGLNGSVFAIQQLGGFKTHPVNMWITLAALVMFCLSWATMKKIDGTHWAKYSRINNSFRILFGTLGPVSLSSIQLPHQVWWLFFFIWAVLGSMYVAYTWINSGADGRDDVEHGQMIPPNLPTNSPTPVENSSDAAHS